MLNALRHQRLQHNCPKMPSYGIPWALNALRHQRLQHFGADMLRFAPNTYSAQRLTASKVTALQIYLTSSFSLSISAQRLTASKVTAPGQYLSDFAQDRVLNALRHQRLQH